jgi:polyhydroxybutyrate depolymerase
MIRSFLLLFGLARLVGCSAGRAEVATLPAHPHPAKNPATLTLHSGGFDRRCDVYVPQGPGRHPLVLLIHCSTDTVETIVKKTGFADLAQREGFYLAVPEVAAKGKGWTSHPAIFDKNVPADDIGFFRELLPKLKETYSIDPSRIYVAGHLSGGMMAYRLASDMPDQIAAVGVVNSSIGVTAVQTGRSSKLSAPARPVPVIAFHGWSNKVMPYDGGEGSRGPRKYLSVNEAIDFWKKADGCDAPAQVERYGKRDTVRIIYPNRDGHPDVVLYKLPHNDHEWPESIIAGPGGGRRTPAELMWEFFSTRRR